MPLTTHRKASKAGEGILSQTLSQIGFDREPFQLGFESLLQFADQRSRVGAPGRAPLVGVLPPCLGLDRIDGGDPADDAAFVTRLRLYRLPRKARQLPDLLTIIWVEPSSTGATRLRGALNFPGCLTDPRRMQKHRSPCGAASLTTASRSGFRAAASMGVH
jgi:hypothetical protein